MTDRITDEGNLPELKNSLNSDGSLSVEEEVQELKTFIGHQDPLVRCFIVRELTKYKEYEEAFNTIKSLLTDASWEVRACAVDSISRFGSEERVIKALFDGLLDNHIDVSGKAREVLYEFAASNWSDFLKYRHHPNTQIQREVIRILGNASDPGVLPDLVDVLKKGNDRIANVVRDSIASVVKNYSKAKAELKSQGKIKVSEWIEGDKIITECLLRMLENDKKSTSYIISTILLLGESSIRTIVELYRGKNKEVQAAILKAMERYDPQWRKNLADKALQAKSSEMSSGIIDLMAELGDKNSREFLEECLWSEEEAVREQAIEHLIKMGMAKDKLAEMLRSNKSSHRLSGVMLAGKLDLTVEEKLSLLTQMVVDPDEEVRQALVESLFTIGSEALKVIKRLVNDPSEKVREMVIQALSGLGTSEATKILTEELDNENTRSQVMGVLGKKYVEQYLQAFDNMSPDAQAQAGKAIRKIDDEDMIRSATAGLESLDPEIRLKSVKVLSAIAEPGDVKIVNYLVKCIGDPDNRIRSVVAMGLGKIASAEAFSGLMILLKDPNRRVRANTIESLHNFKDKTKIMESLKPFLRDPDNRIRTNAIIALRSIGDESVMNIVNNMINSKDKGQICSAIYAAGELEDPEWFDRVLSFLHNRDDDIRRNAVKALHNIEPRRAFQYIKSLIYDPNMEIRGIVKKIIERKASEDAGI